MKIKNILLVINVFLIIAVLSACGKNTKNIDTVNISGAENNGAVTKIPKSLKKKLSENVVVDAEIDAPEKLPNQMGIYNAKIKKLDNKEKAIKLLFNNESAKKERENRFKRRDGKTLHDEHYSLKSGDALSWNEMSVSFCKYGVFDIQEAFSLAINGFASEKDSEKELYPPKDLPFMAQKEAEKKAREFLSLIGVTAGKVDTYALDYKTMEREQKKQREKAVKEGFISKKQSEIRKWSQNDDCYAFQFKQDLNGITITMQNTGNPGNKTIAYGPIILVYLGKSGILNTWVTNIYEPIGNATQNTTPLDLNKALDIIKNKYDEVIMKQPITVTDIEFSYVPQLKSSNEENFILTPAWLFNLAEYSEDINANVEKRIIINGLTGEQME